MDHTSIKRALFADRSLSFTSEQDVKLNDTSICNISSDPLGILDPAAGRTSAGVRIPGVTWKCYCWFYGVLKY